MGTPNTNDLLYRLSSFPHQEDNLKSRTCLRLEVCSQVLSAMLCEIRERKSIIDKNINEMCRAIVLFEKFGNSNRNQQSPQMYSSSDFMTKLSVRGFFGQFR